LYIICSFHSRKKNLDYNPYSILNSVAYISILFCFPKIILNYTEYLFILLGICLL
jgi:hypothetical protein